MLGYLFAFLSPLLWAGVNLFDKYVVAHRAKHPLGFAVLAGQFHILFGLLIAVTQNWSSVTLTQILLGIAPGFFVGIQLYVYYFVMRDHDVSLSSGLLFLYPILVALLSRFLLNETFSFVGYGGMALTLAGAVLLSWRQSIKGWPIVIMGLSLVAVDLFAKVSTNNLTLLQGVALAAFMTGITIQPLLLFKKYREQYHQERPLYRLAFITEILGLSSIFVFFAALQRLPVTIVSTIGATQVLFVLLLERLLHKKIGGIHTDYSLIRRLLSIILIALGIILLFLT